MNIINRAKNIITSPTKEWGKIERENSTLQQLITTYFLPLSFIGAIAGLIGWGFVGYSLSGIHLSLGIAYAIGYIIQVLLGAIITTYIVDALAPTFKSEKNIGKSAQLVIYSYTPYLIGAVFLVIPNIDFLSRFCGLYGLYLIFAGLHTIKKTPDDQRIGYVIATTLVFIAVHVIVRIILVSIIGNIWGSVMYSSY